MTSLGNQIQYKSKLSNREHIAGEFIQLGKESHVIAKLLVALENKGKSVMDSIISGYEQLEIKLDGSRNGTYTVEDVAYSHGNLLKVVNGLLGDLQRRVRDVLRKIEGALKISDRLEPDIMKSQSEIMDEWNSFRLFHPFGLRAIRWTTASTVEKEKLLADLALSVSSLHALGQVRRDLSSLDISIESFHQSVIEARATNNRENFVGLTEEHFLRSLRERLRQSRTEIDGWGSQKVVVFGESPL